MTQGSQLKQAMPLLRTAYSRSDPVTVLPCMEQGRVVVHVLMDTPRKAAQRNQKTYLFK